MTQVIVLNGGSSSGKTSIARALQEILPSAGTYFPACVRAKHGLIAPSEPTAHGAPVLPLSLSWQQ